MNPIYIIALLTVTLTTNEVKLGTADIGTKTFDVVGLQMVTNRIVQQTKANLNVPHLSDPGSITLGESWTNTYPGPFIATNLVERPPSTNWFATNSIGWIDLIITNLITPTNIFYNAQ
jgi:hypothetical protein